MPAARSLVLSCLLTTPLPLACGPSHQGTDQKAASPPALSFTGKVTTPSDVPPSLGAFPDTSVAGLTSQLQREFASNTGYRTWDHDKLHYMVTLNLFGVTYLDPQLSAAMSSQHFPAPLGAGSVLELYEDANAAAPSGWAILARAKDTDSPAAWFSFEWASDHGTFGDPQVDAMGDASCAACHQSQPGYLVPLGT